MPLHYEILDTERRSILPFLSLFKENGFYLAGGTALALHIGHRDSIDFDFFCSQPFDTQELFLLVSEHLTGHQLVKTQEEKNTLDILIDGTIRLSFMTYSYPLVAPVIESEFFNLASLVDIGCMKLSAITSRTAYKDYVDLYYILHHVTLATLIGYLKVKLPTLDSLLALKSLVYFEDIHVEEILYKTTPLSFDEIKKYIIHETEQYNLMH